MLYYSWILVRMTSFLNQRQWRENSF
jgi:hypothetical protein